MYSLTISKIVGTASETRWSQVHTYEPTKAKLRSHGALLLVCALTASEQPKDSTLDLPSFGKEVLQRLHEQYYGSETEKEPLEHLRASLDSVAHEFREVRAELVAAVLMPTALPGKLAVSYLAATGRSSIFVRRGERLYRVLEVPSALGPKEKEGVFTASGFVHDGDLFVIGTEDFFSLISPATLQSALSIGDPHEVSAVLAPHVHESDGKGGTAAVIALVVGGHDRIEMAVSPEREKEVSSVQGEGSGEAGPRRASSYLIGVFERVRGAVRQVLSSRRLGSVVKEDDIVLGGKEDRRRRLMFSVAFALLTLLTVSIVLGSRQLAREAQERAFGEVWDVVDHQFLEAKDLVELNPIRSRALLTEAKDRIEKALSDTQKRFSHAQRDRFQERLSEIVVLLEEVSGEHRLSDVAVYLDLGLVREGTRGASLGIHEETMVVLDRDSNVLMRVGAANKSAEAVGGGSLLSGSSLACVYSGRGFVFSDAGVVEVSLSGKTSALVVERDPEWGEIVDIESFGGNLYLLDRGTSEVFRYQGVEGGFGSRQRWFGDGVLPDLSSAVDMAIDGDIWVLTTDSVLRFRQGVPQTFTLAGFDRPLSDPATVATNPESERLYVLDRGNRRVVVFDKNGEYREQYLWDGISSVSDMVVSEDEGTLFLLSGSVIYEIELGT